MNNRSKTSQTSKKKSQSPSQDKQYDEISQVFAPDLKSIKSQPLQQFSQQSYPDDPIKNLYLLKETINCKMRELDQLNGQYFEKQQKLFLKTFINMMDRMSNQLLEAEEKCRNIDQQIDRESECVEMRSKVAFYKDQCLFLKSELKNAEQLLTELKFSNKQKQMRNKQKRKNLQKQVKQQHKYKHRKYSLQTKLQSFDIQKLKQRNRQKSEEKRDKNLSIDSYSMNRILNQAKNKIIRNSRPTTAGDNLKYKRTSNEPYENVSKSSSRMISKSRNKTATARQIGESLNINDLPFTSRSRNLKQKIQRF